MQIQSARSILFSFTVSFGKKALVPRNTQSRCSKADLFPFNPERIPGDSQKIFADLTVVTTDEIKAGSWLQGEVLRMPMTVEALA